MYVSDPHGTVQQSEQVGGADGILVVGEDVVGGELFSTQDI